MPDFEQLVKGINAIFQLVFGKNTPSWLSLFIGVLLVIGLVLCAVWGFLFIVGKITELWATKILPLFYNHEEKQRCVRRRYFAEHIESELVRLGRQEEWKDYRFTELEAEVEAEGQRRIFSFIPFLKRTTNSLRREKSLSKALASSQERLILVEGEPGSGKSIALRHVAQMMAANAKKVQSTRSITPIYVNLKELERSSGVDIDRNLIENFILKSLKRINDRDIDKFLDDEFQLGIDNGTWFFLFDSFDELPDLLSSTEAGVMVKSYGNAIDDFLHGMNRCRGIVASRQFRGPTYFGWPRFLVMSLSEGRRLELIRRAGLKQQTEGDLIGQLDAASDEIRSMASNPLFLNLLCEHMKSGHLFPKNAHSVFETYIESRLIRDEKSLQRRFGITITQLRSVAERIAFAMAADAGLGLSPTRDNLRSAMRRQKMIVDDNFDTLLDALEFMKLARSEVTSDLVQSKSFTFAHRRFQEYFATCVVLREPDRISPNQLLTDARWRETAVVMCQTQPIYELKGVVEQAEELLTQYCGSVPNLIEAPYEYLDRQANEVSQKDDQGYSDSFPWPSGAFHLLGLLQDGFSSRLMDLPDSISMSVGKLVLSATEMGNLSDKKSALEISGTAPEPILAHLLRSAFSSKSQWLREVAYRQVARLSAIPSDIARGIRDAIVELASNGRLHREKYATRAHLSRINQSRDFLSVMELLLWLPSLDLGLYIILFFAIMSLFIREVSLWFSLIPLLFLVLL
jgi:NACHT domain